MPTKTLEDLFVDGVKDIYYAERKIIARDPTLNASQSPRRYCSRLARSKAICAVPSR